MKKLLLSSLLIANGVMAAPFVVKDIRVDGVQPEGAKRLFPLYLFVSVKQQQMLMWRML